MESSLVKNIGFAEAIKMDQLVDYQEGRVISRTLAQQPQFTLTLFSISQGEGISAHTASGDALVQILDGEAEIAIGDQHFNVKAGECIVMPRSIHHALDAGAALKCF